MKPKPVVKILNHLPTRSWTGARVFFYPAHEGVLMCLILRVITFGLIFYLRFQWRMTSSVSQGYIGKRFLYCFHIAHTHPFGGVDVPFGGYDL